MILTVVYQIKKYFQICKPKINQIFALIKTSLWKGLIDKAIIVAILQQTKKA